MDMIGRRVSMQIPMLQGNFRLEIGLFAQLKLSLAAETISEVTILRWPSTPFLFTSSEPPSQ